MTAAKSFTPICGHTFDGMICIRDQGHHMGMHFSTERAPLWWARRWSQLPGVNRHPTSILWMWKRGLRGRTFAIGTTSANTRDRGGGPSARRLSSAARRTRVGDLDGHVEGACVCDCCDRADEYNGFASGPLLFTCPRNCGCHD